MEASQTCLFAVNVGIIMQEDQLIMCKQSIRNPFSLHSHYVAVDWLNQTPV